MKWSIVLAATALLLAVLYVGFRPRPTPPPDAAGADTPAPAEFALTVAGGELVSGPAVIRVAHGTPVTIHIRSDHADELHLHGYDLRARIAAGAPAELSLAANRSGRFELELHGSHREIAVLEVTPE